MATINLKLADGSDQKIILTKPVSSVGRDANNDIVIDDESVSTHHAEIRLEEGQHVLKDLGSTNGLRVNGDRATEAILNDGDLLRFGSVSGNYVGSKAAAVPPKQGEAAQPQADSPGSTTSKLTPGVEPQGFGGTIVRKKDKKQSAIVGVGVAAVLVCVAAIALSALM